MLTLLQICQRFAKRTGLPIPTAVMASTEAQVLQLAGLMDELLEDLEQRKAYQQVTREATFISLAQEDQGSIHTIASSGFIRILPDTFYNRSTGLKVEPGQAAAAWQQDKALVSVAGPFYEARLRGDRLLLSPEPPVGETFAFEYHSKAFILDSDNVTYRTSWDADDDQWILPDTVALRWLRAAWKREKGLEYAEDLIAYEQTVASLGARDNTPRDINMAGGTTLSSAYPSEGSWTL